MFNRQYPNAEIPSTEAHIMLRQLQVEQMRRQYLQSYSGPRMEGFPMPPPMLRMRASNPMQNYTLPTLFVPSSQTPNYYSNHIAFDTGAHDPNEIQRLRFLPSAMPRACL